MNVKEALYTRRACRAFKSDQVDRDTIIDILNNAQQAPSWANTQPWEIFVAGGDALKRINQAYLDNTKNHVPTSLDIPRPTSWPEAANERMKELMSGVSVLVDNADKLFGELNLKFFYAPTVIFLCMDKSLTPWSMFDLGALSQSIMLAATERGLATMPAVELVHYPEVLRSQLDISDNLSVVFGIAIGYADEQHPMNKFKATRRPISEVAVIKGFE
ncbi:nitroreductase [Desulfosporosinus orientis DSM 765]|uniref:Nitroreductase n=1 Tax=Desulfosporosinus orientis (strain ATCC 19365 / DSM 765 / NCIMB 8382 / VKM B-1628 / Singapore I) TaxID=768706 RepID=G7W6C9_DESOD|nr:nitroreductase [Desulfosporosinus orientis]AET68136.1 nitroreductase [Desulfosporosinus orientis DSM 765]